MRPKYKYIPYVYTCFMDNFASGCNHNRSIDFHRLSSKLEMAECPFRVLNGFMDREQKTSAIGWNAINHKKNLIVS